jgi:hypothetical protein
MNKDSNLTRIRDYIKATLSWAHGHQLNALATFVSAIFDRQTGCQAALARTQGNQEAACKRLSRLIHNERLSPKWLAESIAHQALGQVPRFGKVRITIDWTTEDEQHLLVVSLVTGRRAVPIFWRAYDQRSLKGRTHRYERAVINRAFKLIFQYVNPGRIRLTADRGFVDERLFALLERLRARFVIRVKSCVKVCFRRDQWETWSLVSNFAQEARRATTEYSRRFSCEEGFRDAKWYLGFKQARVKDIRAWSRLFALFVLALLILITLGTFCLLRGDQRTKELLRRVASRRRGRCELSLVSAMLELLQQDRSLLECLGSIRRECLDHLIVLNEAHLRRILQAPCKYYHESRTHLSLERNSPLPRKTESPSQGKIIAIPQVGGQHHRYRRAA